MRNIMRITLSLSQEKDLETNIVLLRLSRAERFKDTLIDYQDIRQTFHLCNQTSLNSIKYGTLTYSKVLNILYYKVSDTKELLRILQVYPVLSSRKRFYSVLSGRIRFCSVESSPIRSNPV
jgi:hypothetical protein